MAGYTARTALRVLIALVEEEKAEAGSGGGGAGAVVGLRGPEEGGYQQPAYSFLKFKGRCFVTDAGTTHL